MTNNRPDSTSAPLRLFPRRQFVQGSAVLAGGLTAGLLAPSNTLAAPAQRPSWSEWMRRYGDATPASIDDYTPVALTVDELDTLKAAVDCLIPEDDLGPGAVEAGAFIYIDRLLTGTAAATLPMYQAGLAALASAGDDDFSSLSFDNRTDVLTSLEAGEVADAPEGFFGLLLEHTRQGMFSDPIHGGNRGFAGWDLIGYPGVKLVWTEKDQEIGTEVEPEHTSVEEYGGRRDG